MNNSTDQTSGSLMAYPGIRKDVVRVLVADHFATTTPSAPLDPMSLPLAVSAKSYRLRDRSIKGQAETLARIAWRAIPEGAVPSGVTRGKCAEIVRKLAERLERTPENGTEHERAGDEQDVPGRSHPELVGGRV
ncbi:hypothetical protein ACFT54_09855 [Streptomyces cinereoruber]|uniref:hypothetical protein n=1 Tax=Streptomyces cinereoruber TaxID=67260 RepID=UPI0036287434